MKNDTRLQRLREVIAVQSGGWYPSIPQAEIILSAIAPRPVSDPQSRNGE